MALGDNIGRQRIDAKVRAGLLDSALILFQNTHILQSDRRIPQDFVVYRLLCGYWRQPKP